MSVSTADSSTTVTHQSRPANAEVIDTVRSHHSALGAELRTRTWAVLEAAQRDDCATAREALHEWYRTELMPHIAAEEDTLYRAAENLDATRLLVRSMLDEHRIMVALIADLALSRKPFETAMIAASAQILLTSHLGKENDLLLPALDAAGVDLAALLAGMHELLGVAEASASGDGCGCDHGAVQDQATSQPIQIGAAPHRQASEPHAAPTSDSEEDLDVRVLPHGQRHEIIFARLDALSPGQALVIVNDHDPKPLRYQTEALWPDRFQWTYLQAGPHTWRLSIRRVD